jgi:GxxExxY protein
MPKDGQPLKHGRITGIIIRCFYRVYDRLGWGFSESVYCEALAIELAAAGLSFVREARIEAWYEGRRVKVFRCDFLIEEKVIFEVKATEFLTQKDRKQLQNYLACSFIEVGLMLHFGPRARFERVVHSNPRKSNLPRGDP